MNALVGIHYFESFVFDYLAFHFGEGMMHLMDHEKVNEELVKLRDTEGIDVQLSYDGLRVPITL